MKHTHPTMVQTKDVMCIPKVRMAMSIGQEDFCVRLTPRSVLATVLHTTAPDCSGLEAFIQFKNDSHTRGVDISVEVKTLAV